MRSIPSRLGLYSTNRMTRLSVLPGVAIGLTPLALAVAHGVSLDWGQWLGFVLATLLACGAGVGFAWFVLSCLCDAVDVTPEDLVALPDPVRERVSSWMTDVPAAHPITWEHIVAVEDRYQSELDRQDWISKEKARADAQRQALAHHPE